uniref:Rhodanese domain-containing protein n=1 Tax=Corethron hystrix TaxID=216773 RepID=A0A7S1C083_9STRA
MIFARQHLSIGTAAILIAMFRPVFTVASTVLKAGRPCMSFVLTTRTKKLTALSIPSSYNAKIGADRGRKLTYFSSERPMCSQVSDELPPIQNVGRAEMAEILSIAEVDGGEANYVVIDVRGEDEVVYTGKLSEAVHTLPLPYIMNGAFTMSSGDFEDTFGFPKPDADSSTLVFTCKAGIRSFTACKVAALQGGYTKLINYNGGSNDWFS